MNREELKALGLTDEQIEAVMTSHGKATQNLNATITANAESIKQLKSDLDAAKKEPPKKEPPKEEKADPRLDAAMQEIENLKAEMNRKDIAVYASSKGLSGEQAEPILAAFGNDVAAAQKAIDSISQIISDTETNARADEKKALLKETPNPGGNAKDKAEEKPADVANAEALSFGTISENAQAARDFYK